MITIQRVRDIFLRRKGAYSRLFRIGDPDSEIVLEDLARFCKIHETTFDENPQVQAFKEGRREVMLRILYHARLDSEQFLKQYGRGEL